MSVRSPPRRLTIFADCAASNCALTRPLIDTGYDTDVPVRSVDVKNPTVSRNVSIRPESRRSLIQEFTKLDVGKIPEAVLCALYRSTRVVCASGHSVMRCAPAWQASESAHLRTDQNR